nr:uncharacterized protein LOC127339362 [Lolium perenne]
MDRNLSIDFFVVSVFVAAHNVSCKSLPRCRRVGSSPDPRLDRQSLRLRWIELPPHHDGLSVESALALLVDFVYGRDVCVHLTPAPRLALRLPAVAARASGGREVRAAEGDGRRVIPIARCYDAGLARLEVTGAARWEQAVAAAAAADGGVAADAHLGAGSEAMVMEAFLPGPGGAASTRVVPVDFSISSSDGKLLSALAEAIFSCVIEEIGGPDFVLLAHEFIPSYKLQINAAAFKNTELKGCHELANNRQEVLVSHFQLAELGNVLDMYFEDQFTLPGKTFHSHWNVEPSKIRKNNGYLNNLFAFLAGSSVILIVGVLAQLYWPQSLKDKSLFMEVEKNKEVEKDKEVATEMAKVDVGCMDLLYDLEHSMLETLLLETSLLDYMDYCMDLLDYYV